MKDNGDVRVAEGTEFGVGGEKVAACNLYQQRLLNWEAGCPRGVRNTEKK